MNHNELMRRFRPPSHATEYRRRLFLANPRGFRGQFDGVLFHLGRWSWEQVEEHLDKLIHRLRVCGSTESWESDKIQIARLFKRAGWSSKEFNDELKQRRNTNKDVTNR